MIKALWNKKTFQRIFLNQMMGTLAISDSNIVDIGGGDKNSSYHTLLSKKGNQFISIDMTKNCDYKLDLENAELPFSDNSVEVVFCFNVLEHIFNYQQLLDEVYRVLKKDGHFYLYVPFLMNKHSDPYDYFRYTDTALIKLFEATGFKYLKLQCSFGSAKSVHSSISWLIGNSRFSIFGNVLNVLSGIICYCFDKILDCFDSTRVLNRRFLLGVFIECRK